MSGLRFENFKFDVPGKLVEANLLPQRPAESITRVPLYFLFFLPALVLGASSLCGDIRLDEEGHWNLFGRARIRFEQDNDDNPARGNRTRMRIGNFAGLKFEPDENWEFTLRGRVGDKRNARIVDMTVYTREDFSYGRRGQFLDQYFMRFRNQDTEVSLGRNNMPFWSNTEKLWDEDLTPLGVSLVTRVDLGSLPLQLSLGSFRMPDGMEHFHGRMHAIQLGWAQSGNAWNWRWAVSFYDRPGEAGARYLPPGQAARDYRFGVFSARYSGQLFNRPAYLGFDCFENLENYSANDADINTRLFRDETTGYALAFNLGENRKRGDWRFRYVFARVEGLAAIEAYATTSFGWLPKSNVTVHDFRADYSLPGDWRVTGRISPAREIIGTRESTRYRIDFSRSF